MLLRLLNFELEILIARQLKQLRPAPYARDRIGFVAILSIDTSLNKAFTCSA